MADLRGPVEDQPHPHTDQSRRPVTAPRTLSRWLGREAPERNDGGDASRSRASRPTLSRWMWIRRALKVSAGILVAFGMAAIALIVAYGWINPPTTTTILYQRVTGQKITQTWVPLNRISPHLLRAVIMSEDAGFCRHRGVDWRELETAIEQAKDGIARGGSTIPMQVTKNLFLWPSKSYLRKAIEIPLTLVADAIWGKSRMMEIYLNVIEWGPGIFGAEAAAQYHFRKSALRLNEAEAALLAVALPAPISRDAGDPSSLQQRLALTVQARMRASTSHARCLLPASP